MFASLYRILSPLLIVGIAEQVYETVGHLSHHLAAARHCSRFAVVGGFAVMASRRY